MNNRRILWCVICAVVGITLVILGRLEIVDAFWSGMGTGLVLVSILRLFQWVRARRDESYREKVETEENDERNRFLRNKAWAWAGYLFVLIAAVAVIVLRILGQEVYSQAASYAMCLLLVLYWGAFLILRQKY